MRRIAALLMAGFSLTTVYAQAPNNRQGNAQNNQAGTAQEINRAGTAQQAVPGNRYGAQSQMHNVGVDREAAIGHAVKMAIEGSVLWHCAQNAEAKEAKTNRNAEANNNQAMRDPVGALEQHARDAFRNSDSLFQAVRQDEQANNTQNNRQGSAQTGKHQACEEFYRAARDYSRALQVSCSSTKQAGGQNSSSIGSDVCAENSAKVALINHAVGEAISGVALHQMLKHHGERDNTTKALESHAEQMIASSQKAIDSIDREGANGARSSLEARGSNKLEANANQNRAGQNPGLAGANQARNSEPTTRREAARPIYNDERNHSNIREGEAITVSQLAKLGREVIRSVNRLNQSEDEMKK